LLNKVVFSHADFHCPWTTLALQNLISVLLIAAGNALGVTKAGRFSRALSLDMAVPVAWFVVFLFSNAESTRHIGIPVLTVWKSVAPMMVALFERFYFGDRFSKHVYFAMSLIALSALVTAFNDLEYSLVGYCWAAVNVGANVTYLASLRIYLRSSNVSALDKTFHSNLLSLVPMVALAFYTGETSHVVEDILRTTVAFRAVFFVSGLLTTAVCATAFWTISVTNGATLSFIGGLNKVPMILVSLMLFETRMNIAGWVGVTLGIVAGIVFMRAKALSMTHVAPTLKAVDPCKDSNSELPTVMAEESPIEASASLLDSIIAQTRRRIGLGVY
jgi:GDP-mannose transporter